VLNLASNTDPGWVGRVQHRLDLLLIDHAHCEKKAASTAMNLIFRYQMHEVLLVPLSELAREELTHFELLLQVLRERGIPWQMLDPSPYAGELQKHVRRGEPHRLLDTLLACALIEARSCERMKLLSEGLLDAGLREMYRSLLASEARHHHGYVELAMGLFGRDVARDRLRELALIEAEILAAAPADVRVHAG
jgi:tRNA-(ms[2]io[6]A)-hydroxylase